MNHKYGRAMNGEEIAKELDISRQAVSQTIKRAVNKVYKGLVVNNNSPANAFLQMQVSFGLDNEEDISELLKFLTKENREAVVKDARNLELPNE